MKINKLKVLVASVVLSGSIILVNTLLIKSKQKD